MAYCKNIIGQYSTNYEKKQLYIKSRITKINFVFLFKRFKPRLLKNNIQFLVVNQILKEINLSRVFLDTRYRDLQGQMGTLRLFQGQIQPFCELLKFLVGQSEHTLPAIGLALMENGVDTESEEHKKFYKMGQELREELNDMLGELATFYWFRNFRLFTFYDSIEGLFLTCFNFSLRQLFALSTSNCGA